VDTLDLPTRALVRLAAAIATGRQELLADRGRALVEAAAPPVWADELLLQSVLMVGYPRALIAAAVWREISGGPPVLEESPDGAEPALWRERGEATCRLIYGGNYQKLRDNVRRLHPALDAWMVTEGYGRTLARPGLDLGRRELCVVAQVAVLGAERQLHSHLRGSLHAGVAREVVDQVLELILPDAEASARVLARALWARVRS
jgi:4-carboxymuconolactone decarboxylase